MNKSRKILASALCAAAVMGAVSAYAYSKDDFSALKMTGTNGIYTVITDTEGIEHTYNGAINPQSIETSGAAEKIASYKVYAENKEIISVKLNDIVSQSDIGLFGVDGTPASNGYYSVKFCLSEDENTEAFLTGLSETNLDMVQEELISATIENSEFDMESLDFIDAEKTDISGDGDNELCWAASTSNTLHYTGWGQQAGFNTNDDLFEIFRDNFTDFGGNMYLGLEWFFNKTYQMQGAEGWSQVKKYKESGGFLPQYSADAIRDYIEVRNYHKNIKDVLKALESGCGVGISIDWIDDNGVRNGGHAITMWGYIIDKDFGENDSMRYTNIIISDSDSDMPSDENRRVAPNKLKVLNMHPYTEFGYDSWKTEGYYGDGILESFVALKPYSDDIEYEKDSAATCDKFGSTDFMIDSVHSSNDALDFGVSLNAFSVSDNIYIVPSIANSGKDFDGTIKYNITVTKKDDSSEIFNKNYEYTGEVAQFMSADKSKMPKSDIGQYEEGEYTVKISVNADKSINEAYYYNNTKTYDFTVKNAEYDLSSAKINAQIGEFKDGVSTVQISYEGLDGAVLPPNAECTLLQSYYENGTWSAWEIANTDDTEAVGGISLMADDTSVPPEQCFVYARGTKVKFRLVIETEDENEPILNIYSDEYDMNYQSLNIMADESNPTELAPLEQSENTLKDDKTLKFKVVNNSTDNGGILTCDIAVIAVNTATDETVKLYGQKNISVDYGGESETISFNSWDSGIELSGTYDLYAIIDGGYGDVGVKIGELRVKEIPNCLVTTDLDITNEYDGLISLREAVKYCDETDVVMFSDEIAAVNISEPIVIDKAVNVSGVFADETEDIPTLGTAIYAGNQCQIFKVVKNGSLTLRQLALMYGKSEEYGGAVEIDGGKAELDECRIFNNSSGISGGGIYVHGGNVTLKNCSFKLNKSGYGGALGIGRDAQANMINCTLFQNTSNGGAVYNNGGGLTAVYSTFVDNTASSSGGSNITSLGSTNLVGCIAVDDEDLSLSGSVNAFGSYIGNCGNGIKTTDCKNGTKREMFKLDESNTVIWRTEGNSYRVLHYLPYLTYNSDNGVDIKNKDEKIVYYGADGEEKVAEIASPFTDNEYALDALGNTRSKSYGSYCLLYDKTEIMFAGDGLSIYTPTAKDAALITAYYDENNTLVKTDIQPLSLAAGTNSIDTEFETPDGTAGVKYMLWDGLDTMRPIADIVDMSDMFIH